MNRLELMKCEDLFERPMPKVFQVENTSKHQNNTTQNKQVNRVVRHLFLLKNCPNNGNTKTDEDQSQKNPCNKLSYWKRPMRDKAKYEDSKTQFSGVIKESGKVIQNLSVHGGNRLSENFGGVKMNMNKNYDNKSLQTAGCNVAKILIGFMLVTFLWTANVMAETTATGSLEPVRIKTLETTSGTVANVDSSYISVAYKHTADAEYEMHLPIDKEVVLEFYRTTSDIKAGDRVKLEYEKVVESPGEPGERTTMTVKKIRLVKKAPKEEESQ